MTTAFNPPDVHAPNSRYSHGMLIEGPGRRLVISGQVGLRPDGSLAEGLEGQLDAAYSNLLAILRAAGMRTEHLVKLTNFVTVPGSVAQVRAVRERMLGGHAPASTYLEVAGLARPDWLCEVEGEAFAPDA